MSAELHALGPALLTSLRTLAAEIETYRRELPRLLAEGEGGRYAVIKGNQLLGTWDTYRDALQYGHEKLSPDTHFMVHRIDPREVERFARLLPPGEATCQP